MNTLVRISESAQQKGWSNVLADAAYANDLHRKLCSLPLGVTPIHDAVFHTVKVVASADGQKHVVIETLDRVFEVQATPKGLESVVRQWTATLN